MAKQKPVLNVAFIGHVDAGKSTTVGRLLYDSGAIDPQLLEKLKREAQERGKAGFEFAYVMDNLKEERERGVTIDVAHKKFETQKYEVTIVDCPGHRDFIKNMITGASQADAAVLVVDVNDAKTGIQPQTREHMFLARTLGIKQIAVAINKMDTVNYSQEEYEKMKKMLSEQLLKVLGYNPDQIDFIPTASLKGDNVVKRSENMPWYKGPTLVEALDKFQPPEKPTNLPLRIPIQDVYSITGVGTVPVGRVETGILRPGDKVVFEPAGVSGEVKSIEMHHEQIPQAEPGDNIGFNVRGVSKKDIKRGDVCGHPDNPPTVAEEFTAQIVVLQHPTAITVGYTPVFHAHTAQVACTFIELLKKLDPRTGQVIEENPQFLKTGDAAIVKIKPTKPMVIENVREIPQLGRFAIRDMGMTIAAGMAIDVKAKNK
ncbi:translation elongation factor EF-1, subunit alpha [Methanocaldococcus jannaschii DSM 2661]|uniref:Elongation factor 1-alpha n=1 Tax=Methanocaldococcus jannaschii (strain ATCC 43067 / DSM 2661 / JAL-1 / JCM 10045 / NBRC 100440) TaxID=243232 RepID=EF1A_METJA|nr:translation elongation factor EF-1 subunit alpha [Methanocaldococcus jannaschii]Q57770.1 RecName: Full=Elongation factor 1-alpha; Short=EF-1-alpha; AltName: Full=Elongation factor Tu; Short=EF-Tu [Methanocaldococcus jannaschii DSM 2661]AAB98308.1 translation elongation factor EF-1, subunit alpha [Methanocaldococcus jannaschii DSM 2661]